MPDVALLGLTGKPRNSSRRVADVTGGTRPPEPDGSGAERPHGRPIGWRRQAKGARRQSDHGNRIAGHVEKLD